MHKKQNTTIRLLTRAGAVLGELCLPSSFRIIDLQSLRQLGADRIEVRS